MNPFGSNYPYGMSVYKDDGPLTSQLNDKLTLTSLPGSATIQINRPLMSYETEIHMPIESGQSQDGQYFFFDNGSAYDYRICTMRLQMSISDKKDFNNFLRFDDPTIGARGMPFFLQWAGNGSVAGDTAGGFYPFGPDLDCHYGVWVMPVKQEQGGALWQPYNYFEDKLSLLLLTGDNLPSGKYNASYAVQTDAESQGVISIGAAIGLMFPQDLFKPKVSYAFDVSVSKGGQQSAIGMVSDNYETSFAFAGNLGKAALLTAFLTGSNGRASDVNVVPMASYAFGADNTGISFNTKFLGSSHSDGEIVLKITHDSYNRWSMSLNFWMKG